LVELITVGCSPAIPGSEEGIITLGGADKFEGLKEDTCAY
jgi:hypothetical protein